MVGKRCTFLICKEFLQIDKRDNLIEERAKYVRSYFSEEIKIASKHLKQFAPLLLTRQIQSKTVMVFSLILAKFLKILTIQGQHIGEKNNFLNR